MKAYTGLVDTINVYLFEMQEKSIKRECKQLISISHTHILHTYNGIDVEELTNTIFDKVGV